MRRRILVIENDSFVDDEVDEIIEQLYSDTDVNEIKEINFAKENTLDILATSRAFSKLTEKGDEFIVLGMSTFGDHNQVVALLSHFKTLPNLPKFQFVFAENFLRKVREGKSWSMDQDIIDLVEFFVKKGLVEDMYLDKTSGEIIITKLT